MITKTWRVFTWLCGIALAGYCSTTLNAQRTEVKEKPAMYSYVATWDIPRTHWGEIEKANAGDNAVMEKAMADGTIVGYGNDETMVHQPNSGTHDDWWSATSMAGLMKVLEALRANSSAASPVLDTATKHWDTVLVSTYYNWHPGAYKGAYIHVGAYRLKKDAPDDAVDTLSKQMIVPFLEKLLADGSILEYEVDTEAIHTTAPNMFWIVYVAPNPEGLDKVTAALMEMQKQQPLQGEAFGAVTDLAGHRDELVRGNGRYK